MTEEEQWYYDQLDEENRKNVDLITEELKTYVKDNFSLLTDLDQDIISRFLHDNDVMIYNSYKDQIKNVFSISKYVMLYKQEMDLIKLLNEYLDIHDSKKELDYIISRNFTNEIVFNAKDKGELKVKYSYDYENEKFSFYLIGNRKNFLIDFVDIKMLLTGKIVKDMPFVRNSKDENDVSLTYNGMKITIQKQ